MANSHTPIYFSLRRVGGTPQQKLVDALDLTGFYAILAGMWLAGGQLRATATKMYEAAALGFDRARPCRK